MYDPEEYLDGARCGPLSAIVDAFRYMFHFRGRASRSDFWWYFVLQSVASILLLIGAVWVSDLFMGTATEDSALTVVIGLSLLVFLVLEWTYVVLTVRRLHDSDIAGPWVLAVLLPFGGLVILILCAQRGTNGPNRAVKVLREAGLPDAVIAQRLGHSEAVMASVYGAPFTHQQDAAAEVLGRLLG